MTTIRVTEDIAVDLSLGEEIAGIKLLDAPFHPGIDRSQPKITLENLQSA